MRTKNSNYQKYWSKGGGKYVGMARRTFKILGRKRINPNNNYYRNQIVKYSIWFFCHFYSIISWGEGDYGSIKYNN